MFESINQIMFFMKKIILIAAMFSGFALFNGAQAQVRLGVHVNIGAQPDWGPEGYDYVNYYYMPDIDAYYDVPHRQFIYWGNGRWIFSNSLPPQYRDYDMYHGYKVVVNERRPWLHHDRYVEQYRPYRGRHDQVVIRDSRDHRYDAYRHGHDRGDHDRGDRDRRDRDRDRH